MFSKSTNFYYLMFAMFAFLILGYLFKVRKHDCLSFFVSEYKTNFEVHLAYKTESPNTVNELESKYKTFLSCIFLFLFFVRSS